MRLLIFTFIIFISTGSFAQNFQMNGTAISLGGGCYQLTDSVQNQAGSIMSTTTLNLNQPFDMTFYVNLGSIDYFGADGIAFILHQDADTTSTLGGNGIGLGYSNGFPITPSLDIEIDTYDNTPDGYDDAVNDHIAIAKNGYMQNMQAGPVSASDTSWNIEDGLCHRFRVRWDPNIIRMRVYFDDVLRLTYYEPIIQTYFNNNPIVYWGWTGGTGYWYNNQKVCLPNFISLATSAVSMCAGDSVTLVASGANSYSWVPAVSCSTPLNASTAVFPNVSTTFTVQGFNAAGCMEDSFVAVTVNPLPIANAGADDTLCSTTGVQLNASGGTNYSWSPSMGLSSSTISNPIANPTSTTTYSVAVSNGGGSCSSTDSVVITVGPTFNCSAGNDTSICFGTVAFLNGIGGTTFNWIPSVTVANPNSSNTIANPIATTTYTLISSNGFCSQNDSVIVTVLSLPPVNAGNDVTVCGITNTQLTATGAATYLWSPSVSLSTPNQDTTVASPNVTTTYTVIGTDGNTCTASDQVTVTVGQLVFVTASNDTSVCIDQPALLSVSGATSYSWSPNIFLSTSNGASVVSTPSSIITYTVTGTNGICSDTETVVVNTFISPIALANGDTAVCGGATVILSASGGQNYSWQPAIFLSDPNNATTEASVSSSQIFNVTVTDVNGCTSADNVSVEIFPAPNVDAGHDVAIFFGTGTILNATGATNYLWTHAATLSDSVTASTFAKPGVTTTYVVTGTNDSNCVASDTVVVTVLMLQNVYVPTAFTPNNDGQNDLLKPVLYGIEDIESIKIFDRWGEMVYSSVTAHQGWDGTFRGQLLDFGVFTYLLKYKSSSGLDIKMAGDVTLIR